VLRMCFRIGLRFWEGLKRWKLKERAVSGKYRFESPEGESKDLAREELDEHWVEGKWVVDESSLGDAAEVIYVATPPLLDTYPEEDQKEARRRESYLVRIEKKFRKDGERFVSTPGKLELHIKAVAAELDDPKVPSADAVWTWWCRYRVGRCATRLVDRKRPGRPSLLKVVGQLFEEVIGEIFLTRQKLPVKDVVERLGEKVKAFNGSRPPERHIPNPSRASVYRWVANLYAPLVKAAREGKRVSEREFRSVVSGLKVKRILDRWELDHTPLDVILICSLTKMILGRPVLTLCIDRYSRMVVGFYISYQAASSSSVLHCLKQAILPKNDIFKRFPDLRGPWPARGCPATVAVDNGMDLHAKDLEEPARELGIELHYMGAGYPELKGAVERAIGTVNRVFVHRLPGSTFSNVDERGEYPSEKLAAIDIQVFTHVILKWIVDVYHKTPHRGLFGKTPLEVWQESEAHRVIELPAYPRQLDLLVGHSAVRTLWHYGLQYDNLYYNSAELQTLLKEGVDSVRLRAHETSIAFVTVLDPRTNDYFDVPAIDQSYADGLNRHVHRLVMAAVRERFKNDWNSEQRLEVKREIEALVTAAVSAKKQADRKAAAHKNQVDSAEVFDARAASDAYERALDAAEEARGKETFVDHADDDELPDFAVENKELARA
jgi:putative transposase